MSRASRQHGHADFAEPMEEPRAVDLAMRLTAVHGAQAASVASAMLVNALSAGKISHADVYHATGVILRDQDGAYARLRRR